MTLTVLSVAYALATVSPEAVGGAEQVLSLLDRELVARGARSIVVACDGSRTSDVLCATSAPPSRLDDAARSAAWAAHRRAIAEARRTWNVDLVHYHGVDFHEYLADSGEPALVTLHLPLAWYPARALVAPGRNVHLHCVSESQRRAARISVPVLPTIENGVSIPPPDPGWRKQGYAAALGRICPEKGFHLAMDSARRAGVPLRLAGQLFGYPPHVAYFEQELAPRLDARRHFIGAVHGQQKWRFLSEAQCVVVPSLVEETSSLVAMEALACGTPVVAFRRGALAEVIRDGETGFLVSNVEEMSVAIQRAFDGEIEPDACRRAAGERFTAERMVDRYLALYTELVERPEVEAWVA